MTPRQSRVPLIALILVLTALLGAAWAQPQWQTPLDDISEGDTVAAMRAWQRADIEADRAAAEQIAELSGRIDELNQTLTAFGATVERLARATERQNETLMEIADSTENAAAGARQLRPAVEGGLEAVRDQIEKIKVEIPPPPTERNVDNFGIPGPESIELNTTSTFQLMRIPGLGPVLSARIIEYRDRHGPFEVMEQLLNVPGIGEKTLESLRLYLRIDPPEPVVEPDPSQPDVG